MDRQIYNTLVVAGGASKCIAAIGSLFYLNEFKQIDFIENYAGTSAGALICYLMCIGYTPFEIIHFLCKSNFIEEFQNINLAALLEQKGLINYYVVQEYLEKLTINKIGFLPTFKDLRLKFGKNLTVATFNNTKNDVEYINAVTHPDMTCLTALRMSVNVPLLFERFFYNNCEYLDGGLVDNFPIEYYNKQEHKIIGIDINPWSDVALKKQNYVTYLLKIALVPYKFFASTKKAVPKDALIITINTEIDSFDFNLDIKKRLDLFSKGYQTAKLAFEEREKASEKESGKKDEKEIEKTTEKAIEKESGKKDEKEIETEKKETEKEDEKEADKTEKVTKKEDEKVTEKEEVDTVKTSLGTDPETSGTKENAE